ncbi:MAG: choice-of-anchor D domain-containing protein [bacterium]
MKKILKFLVLALFLYTVPAVAQTYTVIQDSIVGNVHLLADRVYLIRGYVYIVDGSTLTIDPGTVLVGEKVSKGCIIAERGGKLIAKGTAQKPIVFTSQNPIGQRAAGDWGGIVLCGKAPINQNNSNNGGLFLGGDAQIEGGPRSHYGGTVPHDNSGDLEYVRIEFPGIPLAPNNEINGLTFGGVGDGTIIDHVQVSYSGDDSYEWFGGNVNCKHLIALRGLDDEWDTDFGFSGKVQFCVSLRDPNVADISQSNGFESDNDNPANFWGPRTSAIFCNMTVVGPQSDTSAAYNPLFGRGAHIRRNTQLNIYNSIVMGWPVGLLLDQTGVVNSAIFDTLQIRNCIWAGLRANNGFITNISGFDAAAWYRTPAYANSDYVQPASVMLTNAFNLTAPNFVPLAGSPALGGASFTNPRMATDPFFEKVSYRGAFGPGPRWDSVWTNYDPQNTSYDPAAAAVVTSVTFPNTVVNAFKDSTVVLIKNTGLVPATVLSTSIDDQSRFSIVNAPGSFTILPGETKSIAIRFSPIDTFASTAKISFTIPPLQKIEIDLKGKGIIPAPILSVPSSRDFALVQVNQSATQTVTISNTGSGTMNITNLALSGADAGDFALMGVSSSNDIVAGGKLDVNIKFTPSSVGAKTASLDFRHNAPSGSTKSVSLTGKGIIVYGQDVLQDSIKGNVTLTNDRTWLIRGYVYIVNGSTLNIEPGTVIYGEKSTKGCLIVERGGKLNAKGTPTEPILFTSQQAPGQRAAGDWGGIILCGRAPINQNNSANGGLFPGGDAQIEGGPRTHYGGTDMHDNSGDLEYVRIEFPGIPLAPNNEINGLTLGGVGDGTKIDHIQVSYSGDDSYEWFGGTVNCKHLIALRGLDDEWDTDFGFSGKVQFCVSLRDPNVADVSQSNGFESDNDNPANFWNPRTKAIFCNMTVVGPQADTGASYNPLFGRGAHIRRNTQLNIMNSVVMGWPVGILFDQTGVVNALKADTIQIRNCIWAGLRANNGFISNIAGFDAAAWYRTPAYENSDFVQPVDVKLTAPFNLTAPNFTPMAGSPALTGASFNSPILNGDAFLEAVTYRGAFGTGPRWDSIWTNYDPENTVYAPKPTLVASTINFPKIAPHTTRDSLVSVVISNTGNVVLGITSWGLTDSTVFKVVGGTAPFSLKAGASKSVTIRFSPQANGTFTSHLQFNFVTKEAMLDATINGTAETTGAVNEVAGNSVELFQNSPNPVSGTQTTINFTLAKPEQISLQVFDLTGKQIATLVDGFQDAGLHSTTMNIGELANGVYIYRLSAGEYSVTKRMIIMK